MEISPIDARNIRDQLVAKRTQHEDEVRRMEIQKKNMVDLFESFSSDEIESCMREGIMLRTLVEYDLDLAYSSPEEYDSFIKFYHKVIGELHQLLSSVVR